MTFPFDRRDQLHTLYGFDFPDDILRFWEFAKRRQPLDPLGALWDPLEIRLVGPFDVLSGRFDGRTPSVSPLLHWRYYMDPPEFFTVLGGSTDKLHWGYYLDDPVGSGGCVASYYGNEVFELSPDGDDLFAAVRLQLESDFWTVDRDRVDDPKYADEYDDRLHRLAAFRPRLMAWATGDRPETGGEYVERYQHQAARSAAVIAPTREGMGVVAPRDAYRPLSLPDKKLWALLSKQKNPRAVVEEARAALREGFPATALKLGKELWAVPGPKRNEYAYELLDAGYAALGREVLRNVLAVHRENRNLASVDILSPDLHEPGTNGAPA